MVPCRYAIRFRNFYFHPGVGLDVFYKNTECNAVMWTLNIPMFAKIDRVAFQNKSRDFQTMTSNEMGVGVGWGWWSLQFMIFDASWHIMYLIWGGGGDDLNYLQDFLPIKKWGAGDDHGPLFQQNIQCTCILRWAARIWTVIFKIHVLLSIIKWGDGYDPDDIWGQLTEWDWSTVILTPPRHQQACSQKFPKIIRLSYE